MKILPFSFPRKGLIAATALLLPLGGPLPGLTGVAHAQAAQGDLAAINRAIRSITTLKANFDQTDSRGGVSRGTLLLQQPGKVRFEYGKNDLLIVANGTSLNLIDYQVAQVTRWSVGNSPLGPLLDPKRDLARYGKIVPSGDARTVAVEARDAAHPEYGTLTLYFLRKPSAPGGFELTGWLAKDAQGNRTSVRLSSIAYGVAIPKGAFTWRDPRPNQTGPRR